MQGKVKKGGWLSKFCIPLALRFGFTLSPFVVRVWLNKIVKLFLAHEVNCENVFAFPYSFFPARQHFFSSPFLSFLFLLFFFCGNFAQSFAYLRNWIVYIALMTVKGSKLTTLYGSAQSFSCAANVSYTLSIVVALVDWFHFWGATNWWIIAAKVLIVFLAQVFQKFTVNKIDLCRNCLWRKSTLMEKSWGSKLEIKLRNFYQKQLIQFKCKHNIS